MDLLSGTIVHEIKVSNELYFVIAVYLLVSLYKAYINR